MTDTDLAQALELRISSVTDEIETLEARLAEAQELENTLASALAALRPGAVVPGRAASRGDRYGRRLSRNSGARRGRHPGQGPLLEFVRSRQSVAVSEVAKEYDVTPGTARMWLRELREGGRLELRGAGRGAVWTMREGDSKKS